MEITVATYNVYNSPTFDQRLPHVLDVLRAAAADVVALQEVPPGRDLAARIATALALSAWADVVFVRPDDGWSEALALLSRFPILERDPIELRPGVPNCLRVRIETGSGPLDVLNTHLHPRDSELRQREAAIILDRLGHEGVPAVICGDFNAVPGGATMAVLAGLRSAFEMANGHHPETTFPTPLRPINLRTPGFSARREGPPDADESAAKAAIDYVLVRPGEFEALGAAVIGDAGSDETSAWASDHYGIVAHLRLRPARGP